jgi:hypothetical protein
LVRAPPCHGGGRGFESRLSRQCFSASFQTFGFDIGSGDGGTVLAA